MISRTTDGIRSNKLFAAKLPTLASFFAGLQRVAPGHLFVPRGMECPSPGFTHRATDHGLEGAGFADSAEVNVNEDSAKHYYGRNIMQHITDRDRPASKRTRTCPQDNS